MITDMAMPNMSGEQLASEIKKIRSGLPVIICSGFSEIMNEERAEAMGFQGFLMKAAGPGCPGQDRSGGSGCLKTSP